MFGTANCKKYPIGLGVLALTVLSGGGCASKNETQVQLANPYWELAWKAASTIHSPIDSGTTKVRICDAAAQCGQLGLLEKWCASEQDLLWVKLACATTHAYAEALYGKAEKHEALMQMVAREGKKLDEWDQQHLTNPLMSAIVAGRWQKSQDFQAMKKWLFEDEVHRMPAATLFFCDWLTSIRPPAKGGVMHGANVMPVMEMLMEQRLKFPVIERLHLLAELSPHVCGTPWDSTVRQELGELEKTSPKPDCETLVSLSRIYAGLGKKEKADELITRAQAMIEAKDTGACLAPWAMLAEAKAAAGRSREEVNRAFEQGIARSSDRPGYFKPVAEALTYTLRARFETFER